jgi:mannose-6-phosphate isomerase
MIVFEVQEYSDLTYRVYDYGRVDAHGKPRELHIEKALEVIRFGSIHGGKVLPITLSDSHDPARLLCACRYFAAERLEFSERREFRVDPAHFQLLVILAGQGNLNAPSDAVRYRCGECWLLPASLEVATLHPSQPTSVLCAYVPDIAALPQHLRDTGIPVSAIAQSVFA